MNKELDQEIKKKLVIIVGTLIIPITIHLWLMQLTTFNSDLWMQVKDFFSLIAIILSLIGIVYVVRNLRVSSLALKFCLILCVVFYLLIIGWSTLTVAINGVGFLG